MLNKTFPFLPSYGNRAELGGGGGGGGSVKLLFQLRQVTYLFVSVALFCLVLYLKKIILLKICILYYLILLNSILFLTVFVFSLVQNTS